LSRRYTDKMNEELKDKLEEMFPNEKLISKWDT
jgi:hypothetical protein